jgi:methylmalonyl-CoA epimerase
MYQRVLDHVGIAVNSLDDAISTWTAITGAPANGREVVDNQGVEVVFIGSGPGRLELLAPTRPDSTLARHLERRGPGLHHLCYRVDDIVSAILECVSSGMELIDHTPRPGAHGHLVAFLHPRAAGGVLIELLEQSIP